jgi:hypothetical protein
LVLCGRRCANHPQKKAEKNLKFLFKHGEFQAKNSPQKTVQKPLKATRLEAATGQFSNQQQAL